MMIFLLNLMRGVTPKRCTPNCLGWHPHREKKKKWDFMGWVGVEGVCGSGPKQLKDISRGEDGGWERVPVSGGHRDKRAVESDLTAKGC